MKYGISYAGSKNKIAKELVDFIVNRHQDKKIFYDLFAGGCAITDCLLKNYPDRFSKIVINDISPIAELFLDAVNGRYKDEKRWISREMFSDNLKQEKPDQYIKWIWSFGNNGSNYIFSKVLEPIKQAFHYVVMFDDWSFFDGLYSYEPLVDMLKDYKINDKKLFLDLYKQQFQKGGGRKEHLRVIKWIQNNWINENHIYGNANNFLALQRLQRLEQLQQLERLEQLEQLERLEQLEQLERLELNYSNVEIKPNSIIYCDIPYNTPSTTKGCGLYGGNNFDYDKFWQWVRDNPNSVYVSEYSAPEDFTPVFTIKKYQLSNGKGSVKNGRKLVDENLYWNGK